MRIPVQYSSRFIDRKEKYGHACAKENERENELTCAYIEDGCIFQWKEKKKDY